MQNQPHPTTPTSAATTTQNLAAAAINRAKKRGSYNCGRCGLPKKGHNCDTTPAASASSALTVAVTAAAVYPPSTLTPVQPPPPRQITFPTHLRRALSFDDPDAKIHQPQWIHDDAVEDGGDVDDDDDNEGGLIEFGSVKLPVNCIWEVFARLQPAELLSAAKVCKGWRDTARRIWRSAEALRLRVPPMSQVSFVGSLLNKCPGLVNLSLRMESDIDSTMLACIAFSCPNLEVLEVTISETATNRIAGDELGRFVADKRHLKSLKMEGCSNLGGLSLSSLSLSTLWLSHLHSVSKMALNCPNLNELSLDFARHANDTTDLCTIIDGWGRSCSRLQNIHIASIRLSNAAVLALAAANLRELRMLSLVLGSEITDASVAAIATSYSNLQLLDLSGSSISDSGIGMICNVFPGSLSKLLLALCPNITSSGIQFATAQLPLLEVMDCGMTICDPYSMSPPEESCDQEQMGNDRVHIVHQKLIVKHGGMKKLSLWGCSGLDALYLNCPALNDLNLNSCTNLHPERLLLQCPNLEKVHASGCRHLLISAVKDQVQKDSASVEYYYPFKRLGDGSKRVRVPQFLNQQLSEEGNKKRKVTKHKCSVIVD